MAGHPGVRRLWHPQNEQDWNERQLAGEAISQARLQLWTYLSPGIVLGCAQRAIWDACHLASGPIAIRSSGGGAVLTGEWMLSVSVILPLCHPLLSAGVIASYKWFGQAHEEVLREMGVNASALPPERLPPHPDPNLSWACFGNLSPWEVVVGTRKIVGLAQRRTRRGVLLTSGLLLSDPDWPYLSQKLPAYAHNASALRDRTTSCARELSQAVDIDIIGQLLNLRLQDDILAMPSRPRQPAHA